MNVLSEKIMRIVLSILCAGAWAGKLTVSMMTDTVYYNNTFIKFPIALPITFAVTIYFITVLAFEALFVVGTFWLREHTSRLQISIQIIYIISACMSFGWMLLLDPYTIIGLVMAILTTCLDLANVLVVYHFLHSSDGNLKTRKEKIIEYFIYGVPMSLVLGQSSVSAILVSLFVVSFYYHLALGVQMAAGVFACGIVCFISGFYQSFTFPELPPLLGHIWVLLVWIINLWSPNGVGSPSLGYSDSRCLLGGCVAALVIVSVLTALAIHKFVSKAERHFWNKVFPSSKSYSVSATQEPDERTPLAV